MCEERTSSFALSLSLIAVFFFFFLKSLLIAFEEYDGYVLFSKKAT
jgi:hypothetical protein